MLSAFTLGNGSLGTVLLHGFLGSGRNLRTLAQRWSEADPSRRFLLPDLTGHGGSPPVSPDTDLTSMAHDVLETAEANHMLEALDVIGHSLGGRVALVTRTVAPARVRTVTMLDISPAPILPEASESSQVLPVLREAPAEAVDRTQMRAFLTHRGLSVPVADWLLMNLTPSPTGVTWRIDRQALDALQRRVNGVDLWPLVEPHSTGVRCFRGLHSPYVSDAQAERMRAAGIEVTPLDSGHDVHVDALDALLDGLAADLMR